MIYSVRITDKARSDIVQAADYIEFTLLNPDASEKLLNETEIEMASLSQFPERNQIIDDPALSLWQIRFLTIDNYLAFYIISEKEKTVYVIRFLYTKRNWISILKQDISTQN